MKTEPKEVTIVISRRGKTFHFPYRWEARARSVVAIIKGTIFYASHDGAKQAARRALKYFGLKEMK